MPRQFDLTIPPEYQVMSTQVTQYGEPIMPDVNPAAMGSFGRRPQDANDAHQIGMQPEVWKKGESPLSTAQKNANSYTAWLRHITRTGQINAAEVTEREGGSKVTYNSVGSDEQESNVKGLRVTGDPSTVAGALRNAGSSSFDRVAPIDSQRAEQSAHRTIRNMPDEHRRAFQDVLARDPSALQSLAPTALAGVSQVFEVVDESGVARPVINGIEDSSNPADFQNVLNHAARKQMFSMNSRPSAVYHPAQSNYEDSYGLTNTTLGALGPAAQQKIQVAKKQATNNLAKANAVRAKLTSRWQQQMVAANNASRNGQQALAKKKAQEAANTQKQLGQANTVANQAAAQKQQIDRVGAGVVSAGAKPQASVQNNARQSSAFTVNPSVRAMQVMQALAAARPAFKQVLFYLERATKEQQRFAAVIRKAPGTPKQVWDAHGTAMRNEFAQASASANKMKIAAERQFANDVVGLASSNYMVFISNLKGDSAAASNWAANAQKYATKVQAAIAAVLAAIDAAKKQQPATPPGGRNQIPQQPQSGGGTFVTPGITPESGGGGGSTQPTTQQDQLTVREDFVDSSGGGAGQSGSTSTSSFSTAELTPGAQSYLDTGSQMTVSDEYVNADGVAEPEFAEGGAVLVEGPSKVMKIALTLGLIAATGTGLYMVAKR